MIIMMLWKLLKSCSGLLPTRYSPAACTESYFAQAGCLGGGGGTGLYLPMSDLEQKEGLEPTSVIVAITSKENIMHISMNYYLFLESF